MIQVKEDHVYRWICPGCEAKRESHRLIVPTILTCTECGVPLVRIAADHWVRGWLEPPPELLSPEKDVTSVV